MKIKKKHKKLILPIAIFLVIAILTSVIVVAVTGGDDTSESDVNLSEITFDSSGRPVRPSTDQKEVKITFWGHADENEIEVFQRLVNAFNELYDGYVEVNYEPQPSTDYRNKSFTALQRTKASVDVLYVNDTDFKDFAEKGYLEPLDEYIAKSQQINIDEMWATSMSRFKYDVNTTTQNGPDAKYWGIPKDIGPTVTYYNETFFNEAGIKVISVYKDDLAAFNAGQPDSRGKTKAEYGITGEVKEYGYFVDGNGQKWFNNQVPMSWAECVEVATLVQNTQRAKNKSNFYGYFTEWWFNYGWSVGGDCIEYVPTTDPAYTGGYWEFTLMDGTKNYIVADDYEGEFVLENGSKYRAGEIISWNDKLVDVTVPASQRTIKAEILNARDNGTLNEIPSQRDAFVEFVRVGQNSGTVVDNGLHGYGICPSPDSINGDAGKTAAFATGNLGMLVDGRWSVVNFRKQMDSRFSWDVAPLTQYREYDKPGFGMDRNVTVHGIEAGHSGSVSLAINAKSQKKDAAWLFAEYIGGSIGQTEQSLSGFAIPSQIAIANTEVFLQTDKNPRNSIVFVRAAEHQTPGDWWYLKNNKWIDPWANKLNGDVRNGKITLSQFEQTTDYLNTWNELKKYTKKN